VDAIDLERVDRVAQREVAGEEEDPQLADDEHREDVVGIAPSRSASSSVWPGNFRPPAFAASLLIGPVTSPSIAPSRASAHACSIHWSAARPWSASISPKRTSPMLSRSIRSTAPRSPRASPGVLDRAQLEVEPAALDHLLEDAAVADDRPGRLRRSTSPRRGPWP
jgi:hypothetical protein